MIFGKTTMGDWATKWFPTSSATDWELARELHRERDPCCVQWPPFHRRSFVSEPCQLYLSFGRYLWSADCRYWHLLCRKHFNFSVLLPCPKILPLEPPRFCCYCAGFLATWFWARDQVTSGEWHPVLWSHFWDYLPGNLLNLCINFSNM